MKIKNFIMVFVVLLYSQNVLAGSLYPTAKITVRTIDTKGNSVPNAKVTIRFNVGKSAGMGWGLESEFVEGKTDAKGLFTGSGDSISRCDMTVIKDGFYRSDREYQFSKTSILRRWEPWDPIVDIELKEKRNPKRAKHYNYF